MREEVIPIGVKQLEWLLFGFDYTHAHKQLHYLAMG